MKNRILWVVLMVTLLQLLNNNQARAVDAAGGELTYEYVNDSTYRFYFKYYRGCSGFPEWNEISLCYRNTSCGSIWSTQMLVKMVSAPGGLPNGQLVDKGCSGQTNTCNDPSSTNELYREWWYSGLVKIPPCSKWLFSVNIVQRDPNPGNLVVLPYPDHNLYVEAMIDNVASNRQSSPYFTAPPPVYTCSGSPFSYNGGVVDPNGDSLVYKLIRPRSATADFFIVCGGYPPLNMAFSNAAFNTTNNPFQTNNTFALNASNGDISFTPSGNQIAYLAYIVEKYRNGVLIGSVMRDSRLEVRTCNTPPITFNVNAGSISGGTLSNDTLWVCSNTEVDFCFQATAPAGAVLTARDNSKIMLKGATSVYTGQGSNSVSGCMQWTPRISDTGFHHFVVSVKDSSCTATGMPVVQSYRIPVYVKRGTEIWAEDTLICPGASTTLACSGGSQFSWTSIPATSAFSCSPCDTTIVTPQDTTLYIVTSNLANGCSNKDSVVVYRDRSTSINAFPDTMVLCNGGEYVTLNAQAQGARPIKTIACGAFSPVSATGLKVAEIAQSSNNSNSNNIHYNFTPYQGPFCQYYRTQKMQIIFRKDELQQAGFRPGTVQKISLNYAGFTGTNPTYQNVKISMRCTDKFEFVAPAQSEFEVGLTETFSSPSVTLQPGWNEFTFTTPYDYDTSKNLIVQFCYSGVAPLTTSSSDPMLPIYYITTPYRSSISAGQYVAGNACNSNIGTVATFNRRPDIRLSYTDLPEVNYSYSWTPPTGMDNPGAASTGVFADSTRWYTVSTKSRYGCEVKDSILVYVSKKDFSIYPAKSDICLGDVVRLNGYGGYSYHWYDTTFGLPQDFSCTNCDTPNVSPPLGLHEYKLIVADFYGCSDTLDASINVRPLPQTHILNNDTTIYFGQSIQLFAQGADSYIWSPPGGLNNHKVYNPVASPVKTTWYYVTGYASEGCPLTDSVLVKVIVNENAFIPNAFSPNGDGINDVFRIGNLTFQRILSFSVFNRYGEEVYKAGINQNGWDGTYKGVMQPLGTYFYLISLELPDGKVKQYKGDVTLIR